MGRNPFSWGRIVKEIQKFVSLFVSIDKCLNFVYTIK